MVFPSGFNRCFSSAFFKCFHHVLPDLSFLTQLPSVVPSSGFLPWFSQCLFPVVASNAFSHFFVPSFCALVSRRVFSFSGFLQWLLAVFSEGQCEKWAGVPSYSKLARKIAEKIMSAPIFSRPHRACTRICECSVLYETLRKKLVEMASTPFSSRTAEKLAAPLTEIAGRNRCRKPRGKNNGRNLKRDHLKKPLEGSSYAQT